jgi:hypothetical protein
MSPLAAALGLWLLTTLLSALIGLSAAANLDPLITIGLWLFSLVSFFVGRHMTRAGGAPIDKSRRPLGILLWIGAGFVTLIALIPVLG